MGAHICSVPDNSTTGQQENKVNEEQKDWLQSAYNTLQKAWREGDKNTTTVTFVPEELQALEDAITLVLEL